MDPFCDVVIVSNLRDTGERTGPADGGNGGHGGGVAFVTDPLLRDLSSLKTGYHGANGERGMGAYKVGKSGKDIEVKVNATRDTYTHTHTHTHTHTARFIV